MDITSNFMVFFLAIAFTFPAAADILERPQLRILPQPPPRPGPECPAYSDPIIANNLPTHELWLHILLQFDRPYEDHSTYRGDKNFVYNLDTDDYNPCDPSAVMIVPTMPTFYNFKSGTGHFKKLPNYPKGRGVIPSMFEPDVKEAVQELHTLYKANPGVKGILKVAVNAKEHVNEYLHMLTLMHAIIYDKDLDGFTLPALYDVIPEIFTKECNQTGPHCCQDDDYPRDLTDNEWMISYFREDAGFNDFHGSWHNYNPWTIDNVPLIHGELFFYFHNQLMARYNLERLSNGLDLVTPLDIWSPSYFIPQNYNPPVLTDSLTRCPNMPTAELGRQLGAYRMILENAISKNVLNKADGSIVSLQNDDGIKYVGCAFEHAHCGDLNLTHYGGVDGIHNGGHDVMSKLGCPGVTTNKEGVLAHPWFAVRDPLFFRWHKYIDDTFQLHKKHLPEYDLSKLALNGVSVGSISVQSGRGEGQLLTFNSKLKLTMWTDNRTSSCIKQPTKNHYPFTYEIKVNNNNRAADMDVNVRIFMAPKYDTAIPYEKLRTQWALMDRFNIKLAHGSNTINRNSCNSSITVPRSKTLDELIDIYQDGDDYNDFRYTFDGPLTKTWGVTQCSQTWNKGNRTRDECKSACLKVPDDGCTAINYNTVTHECELRNCSDPVPVPLDYEPSYEGYARITKPVGCQCGLPEHLLLPRGTPEGMPFQLFVHLTPRKERQSHSTDCRNLECSDLCSMDFPGCDQSNGDPMGFPFDRPLTTLSGDRIHTIENLSDNLPNAMLHDIRIFHNKNMWNNERQCDH